MLVYQDLLTGACAVLFLCPDLFFPFFFLPPLGGGARIGGRVGARESPWTDLRAKDCVFLGSDG